MKGVGSSSIGSIAKTGTVWQRNRWKVEKSPPDAREPLSRRLAIVISRMVVASYDGNTGNATLIHPGQAERPLHRSSSYLAVLSSASMVNRGREGREEKENPPAGNTGNFHETGHRRYASR